MKTTKEEIPPKEKENMKQGAKSKRARVKKFKERVQGNTVYSVGFQSDHSEKAEEEESDERARPPPCL